MSQETHSHIIHIKNIRALSALDDLLLLETKESIKDYLIIEEKTPKSLERLFAIGYPDGQWTKITKTGTISSYQDQYIYFFPVNLTHINGASGSPVLNQKNQVVGLISKESYNIISVIKAKRLKIILSSSNESPNTDAYHPVRQEIENLKKLARKGNSLARYQLASMYSESYSTKQDLKQAFYWLITDKKQEYAPSLHRLAWMYAYGKGVEKNFEKAFFLEKKAAKQGFIDAQYVLAEMYLKGKGIKQNLQQAFYWFQQAANQDDMEAKYKLAWMYFKGIGIQKNIDKAFYWYQQAKDQEKY